MRHIAKFHSVLLGLLFFTTADLQAEELPDPDGQPADMSKPVQVYILLGQSNMLGFGKPSSLQGIAAEKYPYLVDDAGAWTVRKDVRNVRVMCSGNSPAKDFNNEWMTIKGNFGPEIGIGHHIGNVTDAPVMILKSCIGNRSLGWDLLPPGSEPYEHGGKMQPGYRGTPDDPGGDTEGDMSKGWYAGCQYDGDIAAAKVVLENLDKYYPDAKDYEVAGFFWWQGDKDMRNPAHYEMYEKNLIQLIKALRKDFDAPDAKFVTASLGQTKEGSTGGDGVILDAMKAVAESSDPELKGKVAFVYTHPLSKGGGSSGHYGGNPETYMNVGEGMGQAMVKLLEASGAGAGSSTRSPAVSTRQARRLPPEKAEALHRALIDQLKAMDTAGLLQPMPIKLSGARSKAALVGVPGDGTLTFQSESGRTANIPIDKLKPSDMANLALVGAQLNPGNKTMQAMLGVYLEGFGRVAEADKRFAQAGPEASAEMNAYFE